MMVLSPAYSNTISTQIDNFLDKREENSGRIFIIEHNKVKRPKNIENLYGYKFWYEDDRENIHILGMPQLKNKEDEYYQKISEVARDLDKEINKLKEEQVTTKDTRDSDENQNIYLGFTSV